MVRALRISQSDLEATGLGMKNKAGRLQDFFRARILFPIMDERGRVVGFGGRKLPDAEGAKYQNSRDNQLYNKSKVLYGLNWAKADAVNHGEVVDLRGLHRCDRFRPGRHPACRGDLWHGADRGPRPAAEAVHPPARPGLRRRRCRAGRGGAGLCVGTDPRHRGRGRLAARRGPTPTNWRGPPRRCSTTRSTPPGPSSSSASSGCSPQQPWAARKVGPGQPNPRSRWSPSTRTPWCATST